MDYGNLRPTQDIDPRDKLKEEWLVDNAEYFYSTYKSDKSKISLSDHTRFAMLNTYMDGRQDTEQYLPQLNLTKDSKGYANINWDDVYSPMPKTVKKLQGMFLSEDHNIVASAVSEKARSEKLKKLYKEYYKKKYKTKLQMMQKITGADALPTGDDKEGFIPQTEDEATMISNFVSEKLSYELAAEKLVDYTMKLSSYSFNKSKSIYDLIKTNIMVNREYIDDYNGKIRWEWVDVDRFMGDFEQNSETMSWGGQIKYYTICDIRKYRPDLEEEEISRIAHQHMDANTDPTHQFRIYNKYYSEKGVYGYDEWKIPVLEVAWKSLDSEYKKKVKVKSGDYRMYDADFGKEGKDISVETTETIYEVGWIIDTEKMLYGGKMTDIPRDSSGKVRLPYHVVMLDGKSICENAKTILDQMAILWYKLQNAWAKAVPDSYAFDFAALEDISDASKGKLHPFDIIDMFYQGSGGVYRGNPIDDEDPRMRKDVPITKIQGGIGTFLNEYLITRESLISELAETTGISPLEVPSKSGKTATETRLAVASMSDVLKPLYNAYITIKEELAYNTIVRAQILFKFNERAKKTYEDALGKVHVDALAGAFSTDPMEIGVCFEAQPTDAQKEAVMQAAQNALAVGRNGKSILKWSEYLYIVERINTQSGLKEARALIAYREDQEEKKEFAQQQAAIQAQSQAQAQQQQSKIQGEMQKEQFKKQLDMKENVQESKLEVQEYKRKKEIDEGINLREKGIDYELENNKNNNELESNQNT